MTALDPAPWSTLMDGPVWQTADPMLAGYIVMALDYFEREHRRDRLNIPPAVRLARSQLERVRNGEAKPRHAAKPAKADLGGSDHPGRMMDVARTAEVLRVSKVTIRGWCRRGILTARQVDGAWQIEPMAVEVIAKTRESRTP